MYPNLDAITPLKLFVATYCLVVRVEFPTDVTVIVASLAGVDPPNAVPGITYLSFVVKPDPPLTIVALYLLIVSTCIVNGVAPPPPNAESAIVITSFNTWPVPPVVIITPLTAPLLFTVIVNTAPDPDPPVVPLTPVYVPAVLDECAAENVSTDPIAPLVFTILNIGLFVPKV